MRRKILTLLILSVVLGAGVGADQAFADMQLSFQTKEGVAPGGDAVGATYTPILACNNDCPRAISLKVTRGDAVVASTAGSTTTGYLFTTIPGGLRTGDVAHVYENGNEQDATAYSGLPTVDGSPCGFVGKTTVTGTFDSRAGAPGVSIVGDAPTPSITGNRYSARFRHPLSRDDEVRVENSYIKPRRDNAFGHEVGVRQWRATQCSNTTDAIASALVVAPSSFPAARAGASITRRRRKTGAKVSYRLSETARVTFTVERRLAGRRLGRRCVAPKRSNRGHRRCTRYRRLKGSFFQAGRQGSNSFHFTGRLRRRALRRGRYRLVAVPKGAAGNKGKPTRRPFQIVR